MERYLITAALPYANGDLHLGHAISTYVPVDIYARYKRLKGNNVIFICSSDDHGTPIALTAIQSNRSPEEQSQYYRMRQIEDFKMLNISFDSYHYTNSTENRELTERFLITAREKGYIYSGEVEQFYCENDKQYLPDRFVKGTCPYCGAPEQYGDACERCGRVIQSTKIIDPKCSVCGRTPIRKISRHFFFKLSAFSKELETWLTSASSNDLPQAIVNYVLNWIKGGLQDWDITREDYWGFRLPFIDAQENQYAYVWWDAPIGYIASTWNYCKENGLSWEDSWKNPKSKIVHFIGKDIVYHHFLFWPAMLKVAGLSLPSKIVVNGYLTLEGEKMSKSRQWVVALRYMLDRYKPPDYFRFYAAMKSSNSASDNDFSFGEFQSVVNDGLADTIGNFAHRTLQFIYANFDAIVPEPLTEDNWDNEDKHFKEQIINLPPKIGEYYERANFSSACKEVLAAFAEANRYFSLKQPWKTISSDSTSAKRCLYLSINLLHDGMIYLQPIIPNISNALLETIQNNPPNVTWQDAGKLRITPGQQIRRPSIMVEKIPDTKIQEDLEKLKTGKMVYG